MARGYHDDLGINPFVPGAVIAVALNGADLATLEGTITEIGAIGIGLTDACNARGLQLGTVFVPWQGVAYLQHKPGEARPAPGRE